MFDKNRIYNRVREIHEVYGGQRQGGISTPQGFPGIIIFTGESGENHGYSDYWDGNTFLYTGEGQVGDMEFVRGNRAIRDHIQDRKSIFLFQYVRSGYVKFVDEMTCVGYEEIQIPDRNGNIRRGIRFQLTTNTELEDVPDSENQLVEKGTMELLRELANKERQNTRTIKERVKEAKVRSAAVKAYALKRANGICESCMVAAPFIKLDGTAYLEVHHIHRLSDGGPDRTEWVAALCPNCHREAHYGVKSQEIKNKLAAYVQLLEIKIMEIEKGSR